MRHIFVVLLLTASTALGQTVTFSGSAIQNGEVVVSLADCNKKNAVSWTRTGTLPCGALNLFLTPDNCTEDPTQTGNLILDTVSQNDTGKLSGTLQLVMSDLLAKGGATCEGQAANKTFKLCASTKKQNSALDCSSDLSSIASSDVSFVLDPVAPTAPQAPTVTGLDSALSVTVSPSSDTARVKVEVVEVTSGDDAGSTPGAVVRSKEQVTPNNVFRMDGLENGKTYGVRAIAFDKAGNESPASVLATGAPIASNGFFDEYVDAGGQETGGCGAGGGGLAVGAAMAALGFWLTSRRKQS